MTRHKTYHPLKFGKCFLVLLITANVFLKVVHSEISSDSNNENLEATQSSVSTSSVLSSNTKALQSTEKSPKEKSLKFVNELKDVTKEAGGFLRPRCAVTGSIPATKFEWFSNEAPLMEGNKLIIIENKFAQVNFIQIIV